MDVGTCKLCLATNVELQESHVMPKWVYRSLRRGDLPAGMPQDAISFDIDGARQGQRHLAESMLCRRCEDLIAKREALVAPLCVSQQDTMPRFRLLDELRDVSGSPPPHGPVATRAVDGDVLAFFGLSILWRASVSKTMKHRPQLGPYGEKVRKGLIGAEPFGDEVVVTVYVVADAAAKHGALAAAAILPQTVRCRGCHGHGLAVPGLYFEVFVGNRIPRDLRARRVDMKSGEAHVFVSDSGRLDPFAPFEKSAAPLRSQPAWWSVCAGCLRANEARSTG